MADSRAFPQYSSTTTQVAAALGTTPLSSTQLQATLLGPWENIEPKAFTPSAKRPPHSINLSELLMVETLSDSASSQFKTAHEIEKRKDKKEIIWYVKYIETRADPNNKGKMIPTIEGQMAALTEHFFLEICKVTASANVPNSMVVYDQPGEKGKIVAIATEAIDWVPHKDYPLKRKLHMRIRCMEKVHKPETINQIHYVITLIKHQLTFLIALEKKHIDVEKPLQRTGGTFPFVGTAINMAAKALNFINSTETPTSDQIKYLLETLETKLAKISLDAPDAIKAMTDCLSTTQKMLTNRLRHTHGVSDAFNRLTMEVSAEIPREDDNKKSDDNYLESEKKQIDKLLTNCKELGELLVQLDREPLTIQELDQFLDKAKARKINIRYATGTLIEEINGKEITISADDLRNYAIQKGLGIELSLRVCVYDTDSHANNIDIFGPILDVDSAGFLTTNVTKSQTYLEKIPLWFSSWALDLTAEEIDEFPDLPYRSPGYWPTLQFFMQEATNTAVNFVGALVDMISPQTEGKKDKLNKNWFSSADVAAFKALKKCPAFKFHQYKTMLLFCLESDIYKALANINIADTEQYPFKNETLFSGICKDMTNGPEKLLHQLAKAPGFQTFYNENGEMVFEQAKLNLRAAAERYEALKPEIEKRIVQLDNKKLAFNTLIASNINKTTTINAPHSPKF